MTTVLKVTVVGALSGLAAIAMAAGPASAGDGPVGAPATGVVALFERPHFTGQIYWVWYSSCAGTTVQRLPVATQVASFDNRPPFGCQVELQGWNGTFTLCAGRGVVPPASRAATLVRVQPGTIVRCGA